MRALPGFVVVVAVAAPLAAQSPIYPAPRGGAGIEWQGYRFERGMLVRRATQTAIPLSAGTPVGRRLFVDVTASYARTTIESYDSNAVALDGLTDTQVRASYTLGRDVAVVSLALNLPTGESRLATEQLSVIRSTAQSFLPFAVSGYGTGWGVTGGAALARRAGEWSLGVAASIRYLGDYVPFSDSSGVYAPGLETRLRLGVLRLLDARTSLRAGVTFSTFGTDDFTGTSPFSYRPGRRLAGELALVRQLGRSTLRLSGWAYFRSSGDSGGLEVLQASENLYHASGRWELPVARRLTLATEFETRIWRPATLSGGELYGAQAEAWLAVAPNVSAGAGLRAGTGWMETDLGRARFQGLGATIHVRIGR